MAAPGANPYAGNAHADVLNDEPADDGAKLRLVEEIKNRAKGAFAQKDMRSAELLYGKAISLQEKVTEGKVEAALLSNRAMVRLNLSRVEEALSDCNRCIEIDGAFVKAYYRKAQSLQRLSRWDEAIEAAGAGAKLEPENKVFPEVIEKLNQDKAKDVEDKAKLKREAQDVRVELHNASTARAPPKREKMEGEDMEEDLGMRGYKKTADGKTTSYFHTEISDEAKALIAAQGFGKPQKLDQATADKEAKGGASTWNQAGTYEEKGMKKWLEDKLRSSLIDISFAIPNGVGGAIVTKAVENISGDASISVSRGKRRHLLDASFEVVYEATVGDLKGSGKLCFSEVSTGADDEPDIKVEINSDTAPAVREVFNAFVKNAGHGLQPLVAQAVQKIVDEYKSL